MGLSQDEYTIAHSNCAPTKTFYLNPTNTLDNKVWLDIHVIGVGVFVQNNLVYYPKEQLGLIRATRGGSQFGEPQFKLDSRRKSGYVDIDAQLLSGSFQYKEHGFALGIKARGNLDFRRISTEIGQLFTAGPESITSATPGQDIEANKMFINQILFAEVGLSYSNLFYHFDHTSLGFGVTGKYLMGFNGSAIKLDQAEFSIQGDPLTDYINLGGSAAYAAPNVFSGKGFAVDLGFVYKHTLDNVTHYEPFFKSNSCRPYDYKYKLSAALIDFGYIRFNQGAVRYDFTANLSAANFNEGFSFISLQDPSSQLLTNITQTNSFNMYMPVAINLMGDYNFENNFFASGQFMSGLFRRNSFGVKRPTVLAASGRYQRKWFEASASLSAYDFKTLRAGLGLRFAYFTIGTDHLLSYFGVQDFYGTDLYFNLRYFIIKKPGCGRKRKNKNNRHRNSTKCPKN